MSALWQDQDPSFLGMTVSFGRCTQNVFAPWTGSITA